MLMPRHVDAIARFFSMLKASAISLQIIVDARCHQSMNTDEYYQVVVDIDFGIHWRERQ